MNGLERINDRIRRDGQAEVDAILAEADKRLEMTRAGYRAQADQLAADAARRRKQVVAERLERLAGSADMERRQRLLGAKQACIDEAFARAAQALRDLPQEAYIDLLAKNAAENGEGVEEIILSPADHAAIGEQVVARANVRKIGAAFTLSAETRELDGGLVLKKGPVEINCAFDAQLRALRQEMAADVARTLFE
jgi:V/A-type H+-transporting ATPase subunit E